MIATFAVETDLEVEDRVYLIKDPDYIGSIRDVAENKLSVMILWDDCDGLDFQWSNKIAKLLAGTRWSDNDKKFERCVESVCELHND